MAEETQKPAAPEEAPVAAAAAAEEVVAVKQPAVTEKEPPAGPEPEPEKNAVKEEEPVVAAEEPKTAAEELNIAESASFKEETNLVGELPEAQKKALDEFKLLIQEALNKHEFTAPPSPPPPPPVKEEKPEEKIEVKAEEVPATAAPPAEEPKVEEKVEVAEVVAAEAETSTPPPSEEKVKEEEKVEVKEKEKEKVEVKEKEKEKVEVKEKEKEKVEVKEEEKEKVDVKEAEVPPPPAETVVVAAEVLVVEKVTAVDEDGAKTVEAIEETIVAVSSSVPPEAVETPAEAEPAPAAEAEKPKEEGEAPETPPAPIAPEEVFIWGIPLVGDEKSDVILLKFLRARDFKVKDAFTMIKNTVKWRKEFGIEALLEEDLGNDLEKAVFMHGFDKEGHPVCYNVYGAFQDKELYQNCFAGEEKRVKFLRWRIQFLEKSIRKLDFSPTGVCTIVQVNDFKNSPGPAKRELRQATNQAVHILQDNYPEFVAKQIFINVPWWYLAFNKMISPFLTQRTKSKFVFAGPSKSAETLFKYIAPEQVPFQYGGLSREGEQEFTVSDSVTEITIKPASKHTVDIPMSEKCTLVWELRVVGWDVTYGAEFVPSHEEGYTIIVSKTRKVNPADEPVISDSYKIGEPGKIVLTIDNQTSKKKKLLYRSKAKTLVE